MTTSCRFCAIAGIVLTAALVVSAAASNLNLSKSNVNRLTYHSDILTEDQAEAILAELDKLEPMDEAQLKQWLPGYFRKFGIDPDVVKKIVVLPAGTACKETAIILLSNPEDEARAVNLTVKPSKSKSTTVKSSKSNSSE